MVNSSPPLNSPTAPVALDSVIPVSNMDESAVVANSLVDCSDHSKSDSEPIPSSTTQDSRASGLFQNQIHDILQAANSISKQERFDLVEERKKNRVLMDILAAHGLSVKDINRSAITGTVTPIVIARNVFDNSSHPPGTPYQAFSGHGSGCDPSPATAPMSVVSNPLPRPTLSSPPPSHLSDPVIPLVDADILFEEGEISASAHKVFAISSKPSTAAALVSEIDSVKVQNDGLLPTPSGHAPKPLVKSWSSVVSQGTGCSNLALSFFPPQLLMAGSS